MVVAARADALVTMNILMDRKSTARRAITPAQLSILIHHFSEIMRPGMKVWLVARKSPGESKQHSTKDQLVGLRKLVEALGVIVVGETWPGYPTSWLHNVAEDARPFDAVIVAEHPIV